MKVQRAMEVSILLIYIIYAHIHIIYVSSYAHIHTLKTSGSRELFGLYFSFPNFLVLQTCKVPDIRTQVGVVLCARFCFGCFLFCCFRSEFLREIREAAAEDITGMCSSHT